VEEEDSHGYLEAGVAPHRKDVGPASTAIAEAIRVALEKTNDNKAKAARVLGISERSLWYKLKRYGMRKRDAV